MMFNGEKEKERLQHTCEHFWKYINSMLLFLLLVKCHFRSHDSSAILNGVQWKLIQPEIYFRDRECLQSITTVCYFNPLKTFKIQLANQGSISNKCHHEVQK